MRPRLIIYALCTTLLYAFYVPAQAISAALVYVLRVARLGTYLVNRRPGLKTVSTR